MPAANRGLTADAFVAGVGTGGTVMGVGRYLRSKNPAIRVHPLEPAESPTLSTGYKVGKHRIQGISDEFIPPIVKLDELDRGRRRRRRRRDPHGPETGRATRPGRGHFLRGELPRRLMVQNELGDDAVVVTVFSDDNKKYLSTPCSATSRCETASSRRTWNCWTTRPSAASVRYAITRSGSPGQWIMRPL